MMRKINGLHLWEVDLSEYTVCLWITTGTRSSVTAARKAMKFLKKKDTEFPAARISKITYRGTLDA